MYLLGGEIQAARSTDLLTQFYVDHLMCFLKSIGVYLIYTCEKIDLNSIPEEFLFFLFGNQSYKLCENTKIYWISFPTILL